MNNIAIKVENLSKAYQLGDFSTGTLSRDIERWWSLMRGKEDPFLRIGEVNNRAVKGQSDIVWSLRDLDFEINKGQAIGIIGKNGAGKSTLLKILSRVTSPTVGSIKVKGRIASLLEVGTGFHPDLTGRENIFLNGAILGMRKFEIDKHFDAIVDFAGIERYIDTPVKRYSSGMYVRLAFAVAAHLESEILVVDEVLAVGDAEFQKKCLGKMSNVSREEGRTVLFVSHNMAALQKLCDNSIYLVDGSLNSYADTKTCITNYLSSNVSVGNNLKIKFNASEGDENVVLDIFEIIPHFNDSNSFSSAEAIKIHVNINILQQISGLRVGFEIVQTISEQCVFRVYHDDDYKDNVPLPCGDLTLSCEIPANLLNQGEYIIYPTIGVHNIKWLSYRNHTLPINIINLDGVNSLYADSRPGVVAPIVKWRIANEKN